MKVAPLDLPLEEVRAELDKLRRPLHLAILRAKNPFNIGAIIRVAHSFLVREILLVGDAPWYERAAMGMQRYENIVELPDEQALLEHAHARGLPIVALEKDHARGSLWSAPLPRDCIMAFGNEDSGLTAPILEAAHQVLAIPMYGVNHSFPVTAAASIAMAEWTRRYMRTQGAESPLRP